MALAVAFNTAVRQGILAVCRIIVIIIFFVSNIQLQLYLAEGPRDSSWHSLLLSVRYELFQLVAPSTGKRVAWDLACNVPLKISESKGRLPPRKDL